MRHCWLLAVAIYCVACAPGASSRAAQGAEGSSGLRGPSATARPNPVPSGRPAELLRAHNLRRAKHCAPALRWSNELARTAQRWADQLGKRGCGLTHSTTQFGENLAAGTSGAFSPDAIVQMWYGEIDQYSFRRGRFSMKTGHFTQLIWRATRTVGCAVGRCEGMEVWVCNYDPPGNVEGMFDEQALALSCKR